jgi:hypothetical protein
VQTGRFIVAIAFASFAMGVCPAKESSTGPEPFGSITFESAHARAKFDAYMAHLERHPERFAQDLATLRQLRRSDVEYRVVLGGPFEQGVEGNLTTDGERVFVRISDEGGAYGEIASLNSRFAHELEHARQFDDGEIAFARDPVANVWRPLHTFYDIGDEVKAWEAQLRLSISKDYWVTTSGTPRPSLLQRFAEAKGDTARARVLAQYGAYGRRKQEIGLNVVVASKTGFTARQLVRPDTRPDFFGRIYMVV